jgi:hypothetical protein
LHDVYVRCRTERGAGLGFGKIKVGKPCRYLVLFLLANSTGIRAAN